MSIFYKTFVIKHITQHIVIKYTIKMPQNSIVKNFFIIYTINIYE